MSWCLTDIVVLGGPVRVSQRVETSLSFSLFVVSVLLLFGQTLPLGEAETKTHCWYSHSVLPTDSGWLVTRKHGLTMLLIFKVVLKSIEQQTAHS